MRKARKPCADGCGRAAAPGRKRCWGCVKSRQRSRHPLWAAWSQIRDRARRRGIPFDLGLDELAEVAAESGYLSGRGVAPEALHLDRIDACRGYTWGNIQVLKASENCAKGASERGRILMVTESELCPF